MAKIEWEQKAIDFLQGLDKVEAQRIVKKVKQISVNVERHLRNLVNIDEKKIRVGDYRLFVEYFEEGDLLRIYTIKHRKNAYKK